MDNRSIPHGFGQGYALCSPACVLLPSSCRHSQAEAIASQDRGHFKMTTPSTSDFFKKLKDKHRQLKNSGGYRHHRFGHFALQKAGTSATILRSKMTASDKFNIFAVTAMEGSGE
ncbi:hypothetical protein [Rhizobium ruizarguesonis]